MKISLRDWFVAGSTLAAVALAITLCSPSARAADAKQNSSGQLTEESLGNLLKAMGLEPKKEEKRFDFNFKALYQGEEWELTMSAVLSQNGNSIWIMAWLDELPRSAADVPRTSLLRLLAQNDRLGKGKFFAYIASNRRFVLQRVVKNQNLSTSVFRNVLKDLGGSVVETYPHWSVANWKSKTSQQASKNLPRNTEKSAPSRPTASGQRNPRTTRRSRTQTR